MVVTASTGQTPFAKHVFPRFWFQKKRLQGFTGHTILWQALSGKLKSFGGFSFKTNRLQAFTDHTVLGQALSEKNSFPRFWLKKSNSQRSHRSAGTPLLQTQGFGLKRFWLKQVPSSKRSHRSAGTPLLQTQGFVLKRFWFKKVPSSQRSHRSAGNSCLKKHVTKKNHSFFLFSADPKRTCHHFAEAGFFEILAAAGFFSAVFLAVLVALLHAALFCFKLNGGGRTCGMLLGRKPSPRSLSLTDPRNRLGLQYVCSQNRNLKKRILIFKETGEPGLHQNPSPVDLQPPKQQHLQKARAWSVCACVGPTRGYPPRRQPGSCREQNPLCPSSDRKRRCKHQRPALVFCKLKEIVFGFIPKKSSVPKL